MGEYVKKKKDMIFQSGDSLQQVVNKSSMWSMKQQPRWMTRNALYGRAPYPKYLAAPSALALVE